MKIMISLSQGYFKSTRDCQFYHKISDFVICIPENPRRVFIETFLTPDQSFRKLFPMKKIISNKDIVVVAGKPKNLTIGYSRVFFARSKTAKALCILPTRAHCF